MRRSYYKIYRLQALLTLKKVEPMPVAHWSMARVCNRSLAGIADSNPTKGMDVCLL